MRHLWIACVGLIVALGLSACSQEAEGPEAGSAWSEQIRALGESSDVQIVRDITADGVIDESESSEVQENYLRCMSDLRYDVILETDPDTGLDFMRVEGLVAGDMSVERFRQATVAGEMVGGDSPEAAACHADPLGGEAQD